MRLIGFLDGATPSIGAVREGRSVAWVEAEVEGIGVLSNRIVAHPHAGTPAAELTSR